MMNLAVKTEEKKEVVTIEDFSKVIEWFGPLTEGWSMLRDIRGTLKEKYDGHLPYSHQIVPSASVSASPSPQHHPISTIVTIISIIYSSIITAVLGGSLVR